MNVEQAAIMAAESYAALNEVPSPVGPGLVLAGMAIAATCNAQVRGEMVAGYVAQLPQAGRAVREWARFIEAAHVAAPPTGDAVDRFYALLDGAEVDEADVVVPVGLLRAAARLIWERGTANGAAAARQDARN